LIVGAPAMSLQESKKGKLWEMVIGLLSIKPRKKSFWKPKKLKPIIRCTSILFPMGEKYGRQSIAMGQIFDGTVAMSWGK